MSVHTNAGAQVIVGGVFVSAEVERIVLAIKEYEPLIDVTWLPPNARTDENGHVLPAFKITYNHPGLEPYVLFHVKDESEFNVGVLQRIIANDQRNGEIKYDDFEAWEQAEARVKHQKYLDFMEEQADIVSHVLKSPLNTYRINKDLIIKDGIPFNAKDLKD